MAGKKASSIRIWLRGIYTPEVYSNLDKVATLTPLDNTVSSAKITLTNEVDRYWFITCYWIAYEIKPCIDIHRPPYTNPEFKYFRSWGELMYALLKLCQTCWEKDQNLCSKYPNETPWLLWRKCIEEIKTAWLEFPTYSSKNELKTKQEPQTKRFDLKEYRDFLGAIESLKTPKLLTKPTMKNCLNLYESTELIRKESRTKQKTKSRKKSSDKFDDYWRLFTNSYRRWMEDYRKIPIASVCIEDGKIIQRVKNIGIQKIDPNKYEYYPDPEVRNLLQILWSATDVYALPQFVQESKY